MVVSKTPAEVMLDLIQAVTGDWCRQRKAEERDAARKYDRRDHLIRPRRITIKEAAWAVLEAAYKKASGGGRFPANARQVYYAARPSILELTGKERLESAYFTQTLLPDFMEEHGCEDWDVVFDARGTFTEPHTSRAVELGTIDVRHYLGEQPYDVEPAVSIDPQERFPTIGPENRYRAVLFVEKEGFDALLKAARIAERFDVAVMSTKGMSTTAARLLLDRLSARGVDKILVLHDLDVTGFSIFGTLGTSTRRYVFENEVPIVDIGLRLADVEAMELESEPVLVRGEWADRAATLTRHGATPEEIQFLRYRRVELNAMTSEQIVEFIEDKLGEHGVKKVVPDADTIERHARRLIEQRLANQALEKMLEQIGKQAALATLPADLTQQTEEKLQEEPELSWDAAVLEVVQELKLDDEP
jgi:DNA topoisomerase VI subunit A